MKDIRYELETKLEEINSSLEECYELICEFDEIIANEAYKNWIQTMLACLNNEQLIDACDVKMQDTIDKINEKSSYLEDVE